jgi:hypothetical protein
MGHDRLRGRRADRLDFVRASSIGVSVSRAIVRGDLLGTLPALGCGGVAPVTGECPVATSGVLR